MNWKKWKPYIIRAGIALLVGAISAFLSMKGMEAYNESVLTPMLTPPSWVFAVVWTILYALMGISAAIAWLSRESKVRHQGLNLYVAQLIVNFFWSLIFFNAQAYGLAFLWLIFLLVLVVWLSWKFYQFKPVAGYLQIPYIIWLIFAAFLNFSVWQMN